MVYSVRNTRRIGLNVSRFDMRDLQSIWEPPSDTTERAIWLGGAEKSVDVLKINCKRGETVLYASGLSVLIHGVLAPTSQVLPVGSKKNEALHQGAGKGDQFQLNLLRIINGI